MAITAFGTQWAIPVPTIQEALEIGRAIAQDKLRNQLELLRSDPLRTAQAERLLAETRYAIPAQAERLRAESMYEVPSRSLLYTSQALMGVPSESFARTTQTLSQYIHPDAWSHFINTLKPFFSSLYSQLGVPVQPSQAPQSSLNLGLPDLFQFRGF